MPFFFAWTGDGQPFDASVQREDEIVFAFDLSHVEGQIPTLSIDVKNPHIGLLAPGRPQWAWLSWQSPTGQVFPLFYGRLVALPSNLLGEVVTLQFLARPDDYLARKQTIANGLMYEPYYDPIWIEPTKITDPDTVLETYAMTWHVDRVTHTVTISDILFGEDGTEEFHAEESFYDSVSISFAQSPQTRVVCNGSVEWTQAATGVIEIPDTSLSAWNGQQIINDWPKPGSKLDGGWSVETGIITNWSEELGGGVTTTTNVGGGTSTLPSGSQSSIAGQDSALGGKAKLGIGDASSMLPAKSTAGQSISISWQNEQKTHQDGDTMSLNENLNYNMNGGYGGMVVSDTSTMVIADPSTGTPASASRSISWATQNGAAQEAPSTAPQETVTHPDGSTTTQPITIPSLFGQLALRYNLSFKRTETFDFIMDSDVQPIVLLPPDEPINQIKLSLHGQDLGLPIDPGGAMPIGDPSRSLFFATDRGKLAIQYPMLVARAHLAQSARAAKISFGCTWERALNLTCRKNALLHDPRLPGGQVIGKITEYHLRVDGDRGDLSGSVQIETTIGNGTSIILSEGIPTYVDEGYVAIGYQFYSGSSVGLPTGDAEIVMPPIVIPGDQMVLPLTFASAVMVYQVHEGTPVAVVMSGGAATADPTWLEIVLRPVTGQDFLTNYNLGHSTLVLPKLIDLAAGSS